MQDAALLNAPHGHSGNRETIRANVVEVTRRNSNRTQRQRILRKGHRERTARLLRDRYHQEDENAIAVVINQGQIGYLPADIAAELAPLIEQGQYFQVTSLKIRRSRVDGEDEKIWTAEIVIRENDEAKISQPELEPKGSMIGPVFALFLTICELGFRGLLIPVNAVVNPIKAAVGLFVVDDETTEEIEQDISTLRKQGGNTSGVLLGSIKLFLYRSWLFLISLFALLVVMVVSCN